MYKPANKRAVACIIGIEDTLVMKDIVNVEKNKTFVFR